MSGKRKMRDKRKMFERIAWELEQVEMTINTPYLLTEEEDSIDIINAIDTIKADLSERVEYYKYKAQSYIRRRPKMKSQTLIKSANKIS